MSPENFIRLLTRSMDKAADLVEAIDNPALQGPRGWDLSNWAYELVPWGVRFSCRDPQQSKVEVVVVLTVDPYQASGLRTDHPLGTDRTIVFVE